MGAMTHRPAAHFACAGVGPRQGEQLGGSGRCAFGLGAGESPNFTASFALCEPECSFTTRGRSPSAGTACGIVPGQQPHALPGAQGGVG